MKLSSTAAALVVAVLSSSSFSASAQGDCSPHRSLQYSEERALKVEEMGKVPRDTTAPFSYNMNAYDAGENLFFVDHLNGQIYSAGNDMTGNATEVTKIFDMATDSPEGLTLDYDVISSASMTFRVKAIAKGSTPDEIVVVFTSGTLPPGWEDGPDMKLPPPFAVEHRGCRNNTHFVPDLYRFGQFPDCADSFNGIVSRNAYDVFYTYKIDETGMILSDPVPFFAYEIQITIGHLGGGIATLPNGDILWATGDQIPFGMDGSYAAQFDDEVPSKILRLDPRTPRSYSVLAKGIRNSQQIRIFERDVAGSGDGQRMLKKAKTGDNKGSKKGTKKGSKKGGVSSPSKETIVSFMDIGGVTAEEVNAVPLSMLENGDILNFGWGRNFKDGRAREGTYYINHGKAMVLGGEPSCQENAPVPEPGYCQPWLQFGRTPEDLFFGISSFLIPSDPEGDLKVILSEFNTGQVFGSVTSFVEGAPPADDIEKLKLIGPDGTEYLTSNDLVAAELGADVSFTSRGDPRFFHYPSGDLGLLIERTGTIYKLTEMAL